MTYTPVAIRAWQAYSAARACGQPVATVASVAGTDDIVAGVLGETVASLGRVKVAGLTNTACDVCP